MGPHQRRRPTWRGFRVAGFVMLSNLRLPAVSSTTRLLPFGAPSRGAEEIARLCQRAILRYLLPASVALIAVYVGLYAYEGSGATPFALFLLCVCGVSFAVRRLERYGTGAFVFLSGSFVCLTAYGLGLAGDPNGLAGGSGYTLCLYPLFAWVCSTARWQRFAAIGAAVLGLTAMFVAGQEAGQHFALPSAVFTLAYVRALFLIAASLGIAYGFDIAIDRSHTRLQEALQRERELNEALDRRATRLGAESEGHERAAAVAQAGYRYLFENAFDGIVVFDDARDEPVEVNRSLAARLGYEPDDLLGAAFRHVSPAVQRDGRRTELVRAEIRARIDANGSYRYPWRHETATGEAVDFEILTFRTDEMRGLRLSMLRDVTEQLRAEEALHAANRELRSFAHAASHDLKEPLRTMSTFAGLLGRRYGTRLDEPARDYLRFIAEAAARGRTLVDDLLEYAEAGTDEVSLRRVDLADTGAKVRGTVEARLREEGAVLEIGPLPTVVATPTWAQQLLQNLISNALKFKRPGVAPVVTVRCEETAAGYEVAVADNGIGIAEADLSRVFGVFERLVGRDQYEGSGIGLALCHRIMQRVGGSIRVASELGVGTTFTLTFPRAEVGALVGA